MMTSAAIVLTTLSIVLGRDIWIQKWQTRKGGTKYILSQIVLGIALAIVLWGVFWVGDKLSQWMFPSFARAQVNDIYSIKDGFNSRVVGLLLLFLIGPAEEIFWRGYVQEKLQRSFSKTWIGALVGIALYTAIHIPSCNFMLIVAAGVCGVVWGGLYWWKPQWFPALLLSHALWDAAVFVWFPI
jgi:membrane protease YdiL (CAAX protease family)